MIRFYGSPASSSGRTRWMLEEVGVPYEYLVVDVRGGEAKRAEFRSKNAFGTVPFIEDDDFRLAESMAINAYLAERYKPELLPTDVHRRALVLQWSFWAITSLQPKALEAMVDAMRPDGGAGKQDDSRRDLERHLDLLEAAMVGAYVVDGSFTVADVNVGSTINLVSRLRVLNEEKWPKVFGWLERMRDRPAYKRASEG